MWRQTTQILFVVFLGFTGSHSSSAQDRSVDQIVDPSVVDLPNLSFQETPKHRKNFDKYFVFHKVAVDFPTALADISYCDSLARGLTPKTGQPAFGGLALAGISGAIASANRRKLARVNLRRCMFFKGYGRYGLPKEIWEKLGFRPDQRSSTDGGRQTYLATQAKIASGSKPQGMELGE